MARFNEMAAHELLPKIKSGEVTAEAVTRWARGWLSVGTDSTSIEVVPIGVGSSVGAAVAVTAAASVGGTDPASEGVSCTAWASRITLVVKSNVGANPM